jgi:hypothetical protein
VSIVSTSNIQQLQGVPAMDSASIWAAEFLTSRACAETQLSFGSSFVSSVFPSPLSFQYWLLLLGE